MKQGLRGNKAGIVRIIRGERVEEVPDFQKTSR